jgi:hypothetical protein
MSEDGEWGDFCGLLSLYGKELNNKNYNRTEIEFETIDNTHPWEYLKLKDCPFKNGDTVKVKNLVFKIKIPSNYRE